MRLPVALRGYRFAETDQLLDTLAEEIRWRDAELEQLRGGRWQPTSGDPGDGVEAPALHPIRRRGAGRGVTEPTRCGWATSAPEYVAYHDDEWGWPLHGERELFERLSLEAFQSGLSWLVILRKRPAFRAAFREFDVDAVAAFDDDDVARLVADSAIVRNRAKVAATIANAQAVRSSIPEGLDTLLWSFAPARHPRPRTLAEVWPALRSPSRWRRSSSGAGCVSSGRRPRTR